MKTMNSHTLKRVTYSTRDASSPDLTLTRNEDGGATLNVVDEYRNYTQLELSKEQVKYLKFSLGLMFSDKE